MRTKKSFKALALVLIVALIATMFAACNKNPEPAPPAPEPEPEPQGPIASVSIDVDAATLDLYETLGLNATKQNTDAGIVWSSSASDVAGVDASGVVTAYKEGTATITAAAGDASDTCQITVKSSGQVPALRFNSGNVVIKRDDKYTIEPYVVYKGANRPATFTYATADTEVISLDGNVVTGLAIGTAQVQVTASWMNWSITRAVNIQVNDHVEFSLNSTDVEIFMSDPNDESLPTEFTLEPTVVDDYEPVDTPYITYDSKDEGVATVDTTGKIEPVAAGTTTVTASYTSEDGQEFTLEVNVVVSLPVVTMATEQLIDLNPDASGPEQAAPTEFTFNLAHDDDPDAQGQYKLLLDNEEFDGVVTVEGTTAKVSLAPFADHLGKHTVAICLYTYECKYDVTVATKVLTTKEHIEKLESYVATGQEEGSEVNGYFIMNADIDMEGGELKGIGSVKNGGWRDGVAHYSNIFNGTFDGRNHILSNFKVTEWRGGLISSFSSGELKNLIVLNATLDIARLAPDDEGQYHDSSYDDGALLTTIATKDVKFSNILVVGTMITTDTWYSAPSLVVSNANSATLENVFVVVEDLTLNDKYNNGGAVVGQGAGVYENIVSIKLNAVNQKDPTNADTTLYAVATGAAQVDVNIGGGRRVKNSRADDNKVKSFQSGEEFGAWRRDAGKDNDGSENGVVAWMNDDLGSGTTRWNILANYFKEKIKISEPTRPEVAYDEPLTFTGKNIGLAEFTFDGDPDGYEGITISGTTVSVTQDVQNGKTFTVKAVSVFDGSDLKFSKQLTVNNRLKQEIGDKGVVELFADGVISSGNVTFNMPEIAETAADETVESVRINGIDLDGIDSSDYVENTLTIPAASIKKLHKFGELEFAVSTATYKFTGTFTLYSRILSDKTEMSKLDDYVVVDGQDAYGYFIMDADINMESAELAGIGSTDWTKEGDPRGVNQPIYTNSFNGIFDGCGHTLSNFKVTEWGGGLISHLNSGELKNLNVVGGDFHPAKGPDNYYEGALLVSRASSSASISNIMVVSDVYFGNTWFLAPAIVVANPLGGSVTNVFAVVENLTLNDDWNNGAAIVGQGDGTFTNLVSVKLKAQNLKDASDTLFLAAGTASATVNPSTGGGRRVKNSAADDSKVKSFQTGGEYAAWVGDVTTNALTSWMNVAIGENKTPLQVLREYFGAKEGLVTGPEEKYTIISGDTYRVGGTSPTAYRYSLDGVGENDITVDQFGTVTVGHEVPTGVDFTLTAALCFNPEVTKTFSFTTIKYEEHEIAGETLFDLNAEEDEKSELSFSLSGKNGEIEKIVIDGDEYHPATGGDGETVTISYDAFKALNVPFGEHELVFYTATQQKYTISLTVATKLLFKAEHFNKLETYITDGTGLLIMTADVDMEGAVLDGYGKPTKTRGDGTASVNGIDKAFGGTFDGRNHTLSDFVIHEPLGGLISALGNNGVIENLIIVKGILDVNDVPGYNTTVPRKEGYYDGGLLTSRLDNGSVVRNVLVIGSIVREGSDWYLSPGLITATAKPGSKVENVFVIVENLEFKGTFTYDGGGAALGDVEFVRANSGEAPYTDAGVPSNIVSVNLSGETLYAIGRDHDSFAGSEAGYNVSRTHDGSTSPDKVKSFQSGAEYTAWLRENASSPLIAWLSTEIEGRSAAAAIKAHFDDFSGPETEETIGLGETYTFADNISGAYVYTLGGADGHDITVSADGVVSVGDEVESGVQFTVNVTCLFDPTFNKTYQFKTLKYEEREIAGETLFDLQRQQADFEVTLQGKNGEPVTRVKIDGDVKALSSTEEGETYKVTHADFKALGLTTGEHEMFIYTTTGKYTVHLTVVTKLIATKDDVNAMNGLVTDSGTDYLFIMTENVDMGNSNITCIGAGEGLNKAFNGTFDGRGHYIYNFTMNSNWGGLFAYIGSQGVVKNFAMVKGTVWGDEIPGGIIGGLVATKTEGEISNVFVHGFYHNAYGSAGDHPASLVTNEIGRYAKIHDVFAIASTSDGSDATGIVGSFGGIVIGVVDNWSYPGGYYPNLYNIYSIDMTNDGKVIDNWNNYYNQVTSAIGSGVAGSGVNQPMETFGNEQPLPQNFTDSHLLAQINPDYYMADKNVRSFLNGFTGVSEWAAQGGTVGDAFKSEYWTTMYGGIIPVFASAKTLVETELASKKVEASDLTFTAAPFTADTQGTIVPSNAAEAFAATYTTDQDGVTISGTTITADPAKITTKTTVTITAASVIDPSVTTTGTVDIYPAGTDLGEIFIERGTDVETEVAIALGTDLSGAQDSLEVYIGSKKVGTPSIDGENVKIAYTEFGALGEYNVIVYSGSVTVHGTVVLCTKAFKTKQDMLDIANIIETNGAGAGTLYIMTADIDLNGEVLDGYGTATSKNQCDKTFVGTFDGRNHTLSNFTVHDPVGGLFSALGSGAVLENLFVTGATLDVNSVASGSSYYDGGLLTSIMYSGSTVRNVLVIGSIIREGSDWYLSPGLIAATTKPGAKVENVFAIVENLEFKKTFTYDGGGAVLGDVEFVRSSNGNNPYTDAGVPSNIVSVNLSGEMLYAIGRDHDSFAEGEDGYNVSRTHDGSTSPDKVKSFQSGAEYTAWLADNASSPLIAWLNEEIDGHKAIDALTAYFAAQDVTPETEVTAGGEYQLGCKNAALLTFEIVEPHEGIQVGTDGKITVTAEVSADTTFSVKVTSKFNPSATQTFTFKVTAGE